MVFIFWQGIISIHQKTFLEALVKRPSVSKVVLVVAEDITPYRKDMGWEVPEIKDVEIIRSPSKNEIHRLCKVYKDAVHIMGGIRVGSMLSAAFDECVKHNCRLGIMTEPYNKAKLKGRLRALKYQYYKHRYARYISFVLAIGKQGVAQYMEHGFEKEKIFPWAYFISLENRSEGNEPSTTEGKRIIYAGRIEEGKGIFRFLEELVKTGNRKYKFDIYGTGPDEEKVRALISINKLDEQINIYPFLKYDELVKKYPHYDWVALPSSQKDGWGVIVSEGLLNGLKAICSSICGVSWVVKDGFNGLVFDWGEADSCKKAIDRMLNDNSFADTNEISAWANKAISGDAGADYLMKIMDCVYAHKERPGIPWL